MHIAVHNYSKRRMNIFSFINLFSGYGGTTQVGHDTEKVGLMEARKEKLLKIMFNADTAATMRWNFRPQQVNLNHILSFQTISN